MIYCVNKEKLSVLICRWQICGRMIYSRKTWQTLFLIINGKKMISNGQTGRGMVGLWRKVDYTLAFFRIFILLLFFFVNLSKKTNESLNFLPIERNSVIRERIHLVIKKIEFTLTTILLLSAFVPSEHGWSWLSTTSSLF